MGVTLYNWSGSTLQDVFLIVPGITTTDPVECPNAKDGVVLFDSYSPPVYGILAYTFGSTNVAYTTFLTGGNTQVYCIGNTAITTSTFPSDSSQPSNDYSYYPSNYQVSNAYCVLGNQYSPATSYNWGDTLVTQVPLSTTGKTQVTDVFSSTSSSNPTLPGHPPSNPPTGEDAEKEDDSSNIWIWVGVAVLILLVLAIAVGGVAVYLVRKKKRERSEEEQKVLD